jgi:hypothetical protein
MVGHTSINPAEAKIEGGNGSVARNPGVTPRAYVRHGRHSALAQASGVSVCGWRVNGSIIRLA